VAIEGINLTVFVFFLGAGFIIGLLVPRWWLLTPVPPAILLWLGLGLSDNALDPSLQWHFAAVSSAFTALGIAAGVAMRRFTNRNAKPS
jgi:hypothetical protein